MNIITHKIAGIVFRTETNALLPGLHETPFQEFCAGELKPHIRQHIKKVSLDSNTLSVLTKDEERDLSRCKRFSPDWLHNPILCSPGVSKRIKDLLELTEQMEIWVDDEQVSFHDFTRNRLDIYYTEKLGGYIPERQAYMPEYHVASNFKHVFSTFLPHFSAFLLHSSGVIRGDKAALFLAPDGGGKTTVLNNSNGDPVLSGDQIILRNKGDVMVAHGTPLGGTTSGPCQARVGGLFMLEKGPHFELEPILPSELLQCLWTEHMNYTFFLPQHLKKRAFQILSDACHRAPVYLMRFSKDYVDWNAIDAAMEGKVAG